MPARVSIGAQTSENGIVDGRLVIARVNQTLQGDAGCAGARRCDSDTCCPPTQQRAMHLIHRFFRKLER